MEQLKVVKSLISSSSDDPDELEDGEFIVDQDNPLNGTPEIPLTSALHTSLDGLELRAFESPVTSDVRSLELGLNIQVCVSSTEVVRLTSRCRCSLSKLPFTYLGLPVGENMKLIKSRNSMVSKLSSKLSGRLNPCQLEVVTHWISYPQ